MTTTSLDGVHPASYRDPSGFLFRRDGILYRHVSAGWAPHYDRLLSSGLYEELTAKGHLVPHAEVAGALSPSAYRVLQPEPLPFISYPYEWSLPQLRDAALHTLDILDAALARGLVLKDASAFNIQFKGSRPVLIDTLSFATYREGEPWVAYRQFCEHFVAPLAVGAYVDRRLAGLWRSHLDGLPLDFASRLLPRRTWFRFGMLVHLHMHARAQAYYADRAHPHARPSLSRRSLLALTDSLKRLVSRLRPPAARSPWIDYDRTHLYTGAGQDTKERIVGDWLEALRPRQVWDLGGNVGRFSRIAAEKGAYVLSFDLDPAVVETAYERAKAGGLETMLPLVMDLANPSPGLGWGHHERDSLNERGEADVLLALALVHHLALGRNVPFDKIATWFAQIGRSAIVEFVPKDDPQAQRLLRSREDVFDAYDRSGFEAAFSAHFRLEARAALPDSTRVLYWWTRPA